MKVAIFEVTDNEQAVKLNEFLAEDGKTIAVDRLYTAAAGSQYTKCHYITVVYRTLEQVPVDEISV